MNISYLGGGEGRAQALWGCLLYLMWKLLPWFWSWGNRAQAVTMSVTSFDTCGTPWIVFTGTELPSIGLNAERCRGGDLQEF